MSMKALSRLWPLAFVIAIAFIAFEATVARGQIGRPDESDLVFDTPTMTNKFPQAIPSYAADQAVGNRVGKYNMNQNQNQSNTATSPTKTRIPIPGTDPKAQFSGKATPSVTKKTASPMANRMPTPPAVPAIPPAETMPQSLPATTNPAPIYQGNQISPMIGQKNEIRSPSLASPNPSRRVTPAGYGPTDVVDRDGGDATIRRQQRMPMPPMVTTNPAEQNGPPGIRGALFNLNGTTATERLYQLQNSLSELNRENEELRRDNTTLMTRFKETQDQLLAGAREIHIARKELAAARGDLERLRGELQTLREKVRMAEKEHSAVLQTIGPILQQLLEADEVSSLPPNPVERD